MADQRLRPYLWQCTLRSANNLVEQIMPPERFPVGDTAREAIGSLRGYVYQVYQSALSWTELNEDEFLFLEVAED